MSDTCSLFPPFGDPWPSCLLPSQLQIVSPLGLLQRGAVLSHLPPVGSSTGHLLKHSLSLFMKEAYLLILELWPEGQASGLAHI